MARSTKPVPEGLHTVTPQLVVQNASGLIDFLKDAFAAEMPFPPMRGADGASIMIAYVKVGDSVVFLSDAGGFARPTTANLFLYVADVDAVVEQATRAGAKVHAPVSDMFWGDRWGMLEDPFGNTWQVATHVEDVSSEEMQRRVATLPRPS